MRPEAKQSFFRFFLGFLAILLVSFIITGAASYFAGTHVDPTTQPACQEGTTC